jgi:DNA-binding response OmpR family regulator
VHALIIEQEALTALMIEDALRDAGFVSFDLVCSAPEVLAAAQRRCPDLIVVDSGIGAGSAIGAVQAICTEKPIPVIVVAAIAGDVRERLSDALVVQKPFGAAELTQAAQAFPAHESAVPVRLD